MKRIVPITIGLVIVGAFVWTLAFLYKKSQDKPVVYKTETPFVTNIVKKTVATGAIVPRHEVDIKPRVSGVIGHLYVQPGDEVKQGDLIAKVQIIPNMVSLNNAEAQVKQAKISLANAVKQLDRTKGLYKKGVVAEADLDKANLQKALKAQALDSARNNLELVKRGAARRSGKVSNLIRSTVTGMVLSVPVELGQSVIESNTFNAGTTIASVADMTDMIFKGKVDESEVAQLKKGMKLAIHIGALQHKTFDGTLEYIAPKGVANQGAIQFEIRAAIKTKKGVFIRANYSANADIVLARRDKVLAVHESVVQFTKKGKPYVEVETSPQVFVKRPVKVGLSDGINIQILSGVAKTAKIQVPQLK